MVEYCNCPTQHTRVYYDSPELAKNNPYCFECRKPLRPPRSVCDTERDRRRGLDPMCEEGQENRNFAVVLQIVEDTRKHLHKPQGAWDDELDRANAKIKVEAFDKIQALLYGVPKDRDVEASAFRDFSICLNEQCPAFGSHFPPH